METKRKLDTSKAQKNIYKALGKGFNIKVGFAGYTKSGKRVISFKDIAIYNFYGTKKIPARNPLERISLKGIEKIKGIGSLLGVDAKGKTAALKSFSSFMTQKTKEAFDSKFKPNAPSTIKRKGFNRPLFWTGKLRASTQVQVEVRN